MARGILDWLLRKESDPDAGETRVAHHSSARVSAVKQALLPIDRPIERFANLGEIARGGMGVVHRVFDKVLLRDIAMKVLTPDLNELSDFRRRFIEEAQISAQLDHPNVVPVHELGIDGSGALFFAMKLVAGATLEEKLEAYRGKTRWIEWIDEFLDVFVKACDAVSFAHSRGVIHRDLKPSNVMVGDYGEVYVMDWGVATLLHDRSGVSVSRDPDAAPLDREGMIIGSPDWMSPEQAHGHSSAVDERSDVFSLGAILYFILTGHAPFEGSSHDARLARARVCDVVPIADLPEASHLPHGLCQIAARALSRDPAARHPSARALKDDVRRHLRGGWLLPQRTFAAGELVVREGETGDEAYIIQQGTCRVFRVVAGERVVLRTMGPGDVFGETAVFSAQPRTASIEAIDELTVTVVTAALLFESMEASSVLAPFVRALAERFREADQRVSELSALLGRR